MGLMWLWVEKTGSLWNRLMLTKQGEVPIKASNIVWEVGFMWFNFEKDINPQNYGQHSGWDWCLRKRTNIVVIKNKLCLGLAAGEAHNLVIDFTASLVALWFLSSLNLVLLKNSVCPLIHNHHSTTGLASGEVCHIWNANSVKEQ